ncbi:MAG: hypothetical protein GC166_13315 [Alphaproteobacteria bacterium]|nr:hypothetical protein [Alphaproteobacteria bacterium]
MPSSPESLESLPDWMQEEIASGYRKPPPEPVVIPNIDLTAFRTEVDVLADVEIEAVLKALLVEAREIARGSASILATPAYGTQHTQCLRNFESATDMGIRIAETIGRLRGALSDEKRQVIRVERVDLARPEGEGAPAIPENE